MRIFLVLNLVTFFSSYSFAQKECINKIAKSEISKAIAGTPGAGSRKCTKSGLHECICFDGIDWETASFDGSKLSSLKTPKEKEAEINTKRAERESRILQKVQNLSATFQDCHDNYADYVQNQKAKEHACRAELYKTLPKILKGVMQALED